MTAIPDKFDLNQLFFEHHEGSFDEKNYEFKAVCRTGIDQKAEEFEADKSIPIGDLKQTFNVTCVEFYCKKTDTFAKESELQDIVQKCASQATKTAVNVFQMMMAGGREYVDKKRARWVKNARKSNTQIG